MQGINDSTVREVTQRGDETCDSLTSSTLSNPAAPSTRTESVIPFFELVSAAAPVALALRPPPRVAAPVALTCSSNCGSTATGSVVDSFETESGRRAARGDATPAAAAAGDETAEGETGTTKTLTGFSSVQGLPASSTRQTSRSDTWVRDDSADASDET